MIDYAYKDRQAFINPTPADTRARKVRLAIAELGTRYVCHALNKVRRAPPVMPYFLRNALDLV